MTKSLHHLILACPLIRIVWRDSWWGLITLLFLDQSFSSWVKAILKLVALLALSPSNVHPFQLFALNAIDLVWASQNKLVHGSPSVDVVQLVGQIILTS